MDALAQQNRLTPAERETLEMALRRMRRETSSNGRSITFGELLEALRRESYAQERAGATYLRDVLDASHNLILAALIEKEDRKFFRSRNR